MPPGSRSLLGGSHLSRITPLLALLLALPAFAGCLGGAEDAPVESAVAASAKDAGAVSGPAPAAAKAPYQVQSGEAATAQATTIYPMSIQTNAAKAPYTNEFTGEYSPQECAPTGGGLPLGGLGLAQGGKRFDVTDVFAKNDVFSFEVTLTWTNTDQSWGDLHLWHQFDAVNNYYSQPTNEARGEVVLNFTGQGFIVADDFFAMVGVECWYGFVTQPIQFKITLAVTFAEGAIPSQAPVLVKIPEGATRMFLTGVALDDSQPVLSHYRVFAPDDSLLCECALNSDETTDVLEIPAAGDYVILVDHTANGFVALGLDVPSTEALVPLAFELIRYDIASSDGAGPVDATVTLDMPSTPLALFAWVFAPGPMNGPPDVGSGHNVKLVLENGRGEVLRMSMVGYVTYHASLPGMFTTNDWYAVPLDGDWEFFVDHHAYDVGPHQAKVTADQMRGSAVIFAQLYVRPA